MNKDTMGALALLACMLGAGAQAAETRAPSEQERTSFQAFHRQRPGTGGAPVFDITRAGAEHGWRIEAYQDGTPRRALRTLCRMERQVFILDGQWRAGPVRQFAWHDRARCAAPAAPAAIALAQRMPDTDILDLIAHQGALLTRARLLFAGNTACASQRAFDYRLVAIDVSAFIDGSEEMATLTYRSERGPTARVWARRSGLAYDPWNVSCP